MTYDKTKMNISKTESIRNAVMKAIDNNDTESALELVEHWDSKFPLEEEGRSIFYFTKLQALLKCYKLTEDSNEKVECLRRAIETGNKFFASNEKEGFPMDSEVQQMWFELIDISAELVAYYLEGTDDEDDYDDCSDFDDSSEEECPDIFSEAIYARIGRVNQPNLKPKPPRKYDGSLRSRLLKAIDLHIQEYGDIDSVAYNLIKNICETLDIGFKDFYNSIYDY